jgi:hypothetical protein
MATSFIPLAGLQAVYDDDDTAATVTVYLLDATVTELLDGYDNVSDLPGLLPTGGGYDATTGLAAGAWPLYFDADAAVMELSLPDTSWASDETLSVTFRWVVLALPGGTVLTAVDFGSAQTLSDAPLQLYATRSTELPNSYPVFRWRKA